ncbi:MAG: hypothetical protein KTR31_27450 [Myxococcales bacterium]|nr:hypothetical protein [Myxococcales bacterium]
MRWIVALGLLCGCDESEPEPTSDCDVLSLETCAETSGCWLIEAWEAQDDGAGGICVDYASPRVAVGCSSEDVDCSDVIVPGTSPEGVSYVFSNSCLPADFTEGDSYAAECGG